MISFFCNLWGREHLSTWSDIIREKLPSSMVDDTDEGHISSEDLHHLCGGITNLESTGSDSSVVANDKSVYRY